MGKGWEVGIVQAEKDKAPGRPYIINYLIIGIIIKLFNYWNNN